LTGSLTPERGGGIKPLGYQEPDPMEIEKKYNRYEIELKFQVVQEKAGERFEP